MTFRTGALQNLPNTLDQEPKTQPPTATSRPPTVTRSWTGRRHPFQQVSLGHPGRALSGSVPRASVPFMELDPCHGVQLVSQQVMQYAGTKRRTRHRVMQTTVSPLPQVPTHLSKSVVDCLAEEERHEGVTLFSTFVLPNQTPLTFRVFPCVP